MKFQDSSFNGLKVTVGTKKCDACMDARTHAPKAICPTNFSKFGAKKVSIHTVVMSHEVGKVIYHTNFFNKYCT